MSSKKYYYGTGKRKSAIARVRVFNTPGEITINGKALQEAIPVEIWQKSATRPLDLLDLKSQECCHVNKIEIRN